MTHQQPSDRELIEFIRENGHWPRDVDFNEMPDRLESALDRIEELEREYKDMNKQTLKAQETCLQALAREAELKKLVQLERDRWEVIRATQGQCVIQISDKEIELISTLRDRELSRILDREAVAVEALEKALDVGVKHHSANSDNHILGWVRSTLREALAKIEEMKNDN